MILDLMAILVVFLIIVFLVPLIYIVFHETVITLFDCLVELWAICLEFWMDFFEKISDLCSSFIDFIEKRKNE
jgi:hypothetical protein